MGVDSFESLDEKHLLNWLKKDSLAFDPLSLSKTEDVIELIDSLL